MILKHVPMRSLGKSDFAGLASYITDAQSKEHRLGEVRLTNCHAGMVGDAITEVLATQHGNTRATGDKTYHLLVSFPPGENPRAEELQQIEDRVCAALGYDGHQRISAVHNDTDHLHIHVAINKIHPVRHTMHEPFLAYRTMAEVAVKLENEFGLQRVNHADKRSLSVGRAGDMEHHAGVESLLGWIRRECLDEIKGAQTWPELHQVLRDNGLQLRVRANGFVVEASDGTMVKASTVARDLSRPNLEARLGPFEPSAELQTPAIAKRQYRKDPIRLRVNTVELYAKYQAEQMSLTTARTQSLEHARHRKDRLIEEAKRSNRLRRATINLVGDGRISKKLLYAQASKALRSEIQAINQQYQQERAVLYTEHSRRTWADWLRKEAQHGNTEALAALRAREKTGLKGNTIQGEGLALPGHAQAVDSITKKGTIIFRAGMSAVRDDGDRLQVSREATREGLQAALRLAQQRYGNRITVNGTVQFKAQIIRAAVDSQLHITFADPALESRRQALLHKESTHERTERPEHRGGTGRGAGGPGQRPAADQHATGAEAGRSAYAEPCLHAAPVHRKSDIGRPGRKPPPQGQHRLRTLSELGVVRIAGGSEVLLPRDVPRHVEQQGTQPDHALRRGIPRPGIGVSQTLPALEAADRYIAEREAKRQNGFDIPKHCRYTAGDGTLAFHGIRHVEGQTLALLKRGDEVMVMPIDPAAVRRLTRIAIGDVVSISAKGSITRSKGRSR